jgi:hypothetical protein
MRSRCHLHQRQSHDPHHRRADPLQYASEAHEPVEGGLHEHDLRDEESHQTDDQGHAAAVISF